MNEHTATALEFLAQLMFLLFHHAAAEPQSRRAARYGFFRNSSFDAEKPSMVAFCQMGLRLSWLS